jgi:hypothetical protein
VPIELLEERLCFSPRHSRISAVPVVVRTFSEGIETGLLAAVSSAMRSSKRMVEGFKPPSAFSCSR